MNTRSLLRSLSVPALSLVAGLLICAPRPAHAAGHFAVGHAGGFGFHGGGFHGGGFRGGGFRGGGFRGFGFRGGFGYGWWGWPGYGLFLATLPFYYSTVWWDGVPYYYADDYYYVWNPAAGGYQAVSPPQIANRSPMTPNGNQLFAYPKNGQSDEQQARDKQECRDWAASQTGSGAGTSAGDNVRAQTACLAGRGYSVR